MISMSRLNRDHYDFGPYPGQRARRLGELGLVVALMAMIAASGYLVFWWAPAQMGAAVEAAAQREHCLTRPRKPSVECGELRRD